MEKFRVCLHSVMPVLVTGIHATAEIKDLAWMPAMNAGMTILEAECGRMHAEGQP